MPFGLPAKKWLDELTTRMPPLWQCLCAHFYDFIQAYPEKYEKKYGFLKPVVEDVVNKYLDCGELTKGLPFRFAYSCTFVQAVSLRSAPQQPPAPEVLASRPRSVSGKLCRIANECLLEFLRRSLNRPAGQLGMVWPEVRESKFLIGRSEARSGFATQGGLTKAA